MSPLSLDTMALQTVLRRALSPLYFKSCPLLTCAFQHKPKRPYSSQDSNSFLTVSMNEKTGVATLEMHKKPVNSLNLEFFTQLNITLEKLENEKECKGLIISSRIPKIFSAGLDILEMYQPKPERLAEFWRNFQEFFLRLYGSRYITMAAIQGHAPAGGCLICISSDYRVMASGPYSIGLNETLLGIVAPFWFKDAMVNTVGHRETEHALQLGRLYTVDQAHKIGLVDEVCDENQVISKLEEEMGKWLKIPETARYLSKLSLRKETLDRLVAKREDDITTFVEYIMKDSIQKALGAYLASLKKGK